MDVALKAKNEIIPMHHTAIFWINNREQLMGLI
jgi:hypothetical protein